MGFGFVAGSIELRWLTRRLVHRKSHGGVVVWVGRLSVWIATQCVFLPTTAGTSTSEAL
jgi:hypothetical protein